VNRARFLGGLMLALLLLAGAIFLLLPRGVPPPGPRPAGPVPAASSTTSWPFTFADALGYSVTLARPAQRIITMSPNLAEMVCAIGAGPELVGVDDFTKYPPEAAARQKIGGITNPDLERVLALQPDLLLVARGLDKDRIQRLRELACPVATFDPQSLEEVLKATELIGRITGRDQRAAQVTANLRRRLARVRSRTESYLQTHAGRRPRVLLVIAWDGLYVGGQGGFANDLITTAGGENAVARMKGIPADQPWPTVTRELVVVSDPQIIIFTGTGATPSGRDAQGTLRLLREDAAWAQLSAVKNGQVLVLPEDPLTIPGPRLFDGVEALQEALIACPCGS
jgi:iron complex transport system substrate-binding protein